MSSAILQEVREKASHALGLWGSRFGGDSTPWWLSVRSASLPVDGAASLGQLWQHRTECAGLTLRTKPLPLPSVSPLSPNSLELLAAAAAQSSH